jgi:hypothetical protein
MHRPVGFAVDDRHAKPGDQLLDLGVIKTVVDLYRNSPALVIVFGGWKTISPISLE